MTNDEFEQHVTTAFAFLESEFTGTRTTLSEWSVQYVMGTIELVVSYDAERREYALAYRFDPKSRHTHELDTICKALDIDHGGRLPGAVTAEELDPYIQSSAEVLREFTEGVLQNDKDAIAHIAEKLSDHGNQVWKRIQERRAREGK